MAKPAKVMLNVPAIKADFPILQRTIRDKRLVYLDSAATSQKPKQVIDATSDFYSRYNANVHRAIYELGEESTREYEGSREKIAAFIQAKSPTEIAFTKSTTESLNLVAYGYGLKGKIQKGDEIVGTVMEHHSNHVPWHFVKDTTPALFLTSVGPYVVTPFNRASFSRAYSVISISCPRTASIPIFVR